MRTIGWFVMLLALVAGSGTVGYSANSTNETGQPMLHLMAWDYVDDEATLKKMADCGITMVAFVPPNMLDACSEYGIKAIVFDEGVSPERWDQAFDSERANRALPDLIARVDSHPAVFGYHLKDEPGEDQFAELAKSAELVRRLAPGKWPYINLPPGMGEWYEGYLDRFVESCKPPILSYDNYAIGEQGGFSNGFWANIAHFRNVSLRHGLPFWTIVLTVAHWGYRAPTAADLRLQVYGSLVYGARGVCYYKFCSRELPILDAPDLGNWRMGPLDQYGEKTETWEHLRNVNRQVQHLAPTLLKLRSDAVYHVGEIPEHNHGINGTSLVAGLRAGEQFVIGEFTHEDGSRWVMIVNKHLQLSAFCRPDFGVPVSAVKYISTVTGELKPFPDPWYCLAPGQGVLLKLEQENIPAEEKGPLE